MKRILLLTVAMFLSVGATKKENEAQLRKRLTPLQYQVTQEEGTERPFNNEYWDNKRPGIYVDIVSGEPLFSSKEKYKSGTGWPSFYQPLEMGNLVEKVDTSIGGSRTEVRSKGADSHLGHVFKDGPKPTGLRYCMNSAAMRFIPAGDLEKEGYDKYAALFKDTKALATFAGGCFWCMEKPFESLPGVSSVISGYTGGQKNAPSYHEVSAGGTGHAEAVQITYDPAKISYKELLDVFWMQIDPTTANAQFVDHGTQYRPGIFYHDEEQKALALESRKALGASGRFAKPIVAEVTAASSFYAAEEYHQDYYKKNPVRYKFYRYNSGRDQYLERIWGKERHTNPQEVKQVK